MQILEIPAQVPPADLQTTASALGQLAGDGTPPQASYSQVLAGTLRGGGASSGTPPRVSQSDPKAASLAAEFAWQPPGELTSTVPTVIVLAPPVLAAVVAFDARPAETLRSTSDAAAAPPAGLGELLGDVAAGIAESAGTPETVSRETTQDAPPSVAPPDGLRQILAVVVPVQVSPDPGAVAPGSGSGSAAAIPLPSDAVAVRQPAAPPGHESPDKNLPRTSDQPPLDDGESPPNERARISARLSPAVATPGTAPVEQPAAVHTRADAASAPAPAAIPTVVAAVDPAGGKVKDTESADAAQSSRPEGATSTGAGVTSSGKRLESGTTDDRTKVLAPQGNPTEFADRLTRTLLDSHQAGRPLQVRLHPPELGTLQIELSSREGVFTARLEVESTAARQTILEQLPQLREAFAQTGHHVERIDVHLLERQDDRPQHGGERRHTSDRSSRDDTRRQQDPRPQHHSNEQIRDDAPHPHSAARHTTTRAAGLEQLDIQI